MARRWALAGCAAGLAALAAAVWWPRPVSAPVAERVGRIRPGMTQAEVDAVLGGPPGDYSTYPGKGLGGPPSPPRVGFYADWRWNEGFLRVHFDDTGRVIRPYYAADPPPSALKWLLDHLRL